MMMSALFWSPDHECRNCLNILSHKQTPRYDWRSDQEYSVRRRGCAHHGVSEWVSEWVDGWLSALVFHWYRERARMVIRNGVSHMDLPDTKTQSYEQLDNIAQETRAPWCRHLREQGGMMYMRDRQWTVLSALGGIFGALWLVGRWNDCRLCCSWGWLICDFTLASDAWWFFFMISIDCLMYNVQSNLLLH